MYSEFTYDEIEIGQKATFSVKITDTMLSSFKDITGDVNPLHNDEAYARESGYNGRVAYGMLTASFVSTLAGVYLPGKYSLINKEELSFLKPVQIDDDISITGEVISKNDKYRFLTLKVVMKNQRNERVCFGKMEVSVTK